MIPLVCTLSLGYDMKQVSSQRHSKKAEPLASSSVLLWSRSWESSLNVHAAPGLK